jgi:hypothetical protein
MGRRWLFIETHHLMGQGIGWVDAHLLASSLLSRIPLWTVPHRGRPPAADHCRRAINGADA